MTLKTRPSVPQDAKEMSLLLGEIIRIWKSERRFDPPYVQAHYISHPDNVACTVVLDDQENLLGFQSLQLAQAGNQYNVTPGWGIIGTYVRTGQSGRGIGRLLFQATHVAAQADGLPAIDATIGADNESALGYYSAMGFRTYLTPPGAVRKRFDLD